MEGKVTYVALTLRTLASKLVTMQTLAFLGRKDDNSDCSFFMIEDAVHVEFIEASYHKFFTSIIVKTSDGKIKEWGVRSPANKKFRWDYSQQE